MKAVPERAEIGGPSNLADALPDDDLQKKGADLARLRQDKQESEKKRQLAKAQRERLLADMNKRHAFISNYGGKAVATDLQPVATDPTRQRITFVDLSTIRARYMNAFVPGTEDNERPKPLGDWWLRHPKRREYAGVWFDPGASEVVVINGSTYLNIWQGWAVEPKPGDWSLMRAHIDEVIAAGDPTFSEYLIRWSAWLAQHPDQQAEVAVVLRGSKGSGKGTFTKALLRWAGLHGMQISDQEQLTGKFNGHFQDRVLLVADEAYWAGDKRAEGALKRLITEPTLTIEPKFVNAFPVKNRTHLIMTANEDWVIPASADERRFVVSDVSEARVNDVGYFNALNAEMETGGIEAMLHDLLNMRLGDWHPRQVYVNEALRRQQSQSLRGFEGWYENVLQEGVIPGAEEDRPFRIRFDTLFSKAKKADPMGVGRMTEKAFGQHLDRYGIKPARSNVARFRDFPPLSEARQVFASKFRGGWPWRYAMKDWEEAESEFDAIGASRLETE